jgi:hypothetical protein
LRWFSNPPAAALVVPSAEIKSSLPAGYFSGHEEVSDEVMAVSFSEMGSSFLEYAKMVLTLGFLERVE